MNGHGTSSISKAIGEQLPHGCQVDDLCQAQQGQSEQTAEVGQGLSAEALHQAMERAEKAARSAYEDALFCFDMECWEAAGRHADRGLAHIRQLIALSRITPRS